MERYEEAVFVAEHLCKEYRHTAALRDVTITIPRGQIYGLIGENGAGKTTLLRILCGLTRPTRGRVVLFGAADAAGQEKMRRRMGCLVDGPALYTDLTAWQNLKVQCLQRGLAETAIAPTLQLVGLETAGGKPAGKFSLGMRQRLGLAIALLGKPEFLVLDEPLNGLDPMGIQELRHLLERLNREQGMTILLSSHILSRAAPACHRLRYPASRPAAGAADGGGTGRPLPEISAGADRPGPAGGGHPWPDVPESTLPGNGGRAAPDPGEGGRGRGGVRRAGGKRPAGAGTGGAQRRAGSLFHGAGGG